MEKTWKQWYKRFKQEQASQRERERDEEGRECRKLQKLRSGFVVLQKLQNVPFVHTTLYAPSRALLALALFFFVFFPKSGCLRKNYLDFDKIPIEKSSKIIIVNSNNLLKIYHLLNAKKDITIFIFWLFDLMPCELLQS